MSWDYTLEPKGRGFFEEELAEMARYLAARPTVYRRSDGTFVVARDRAWRDGVIAAGTMDQVTFSASAIVLARDVVRLWVLGFEEQNIELAAFVAACQARWPCELRDPGEQIITPQEFLDQQREMLRAHYRTYLGGT
jgi:hypothetical protein